MIKRTNGNLKAITKGNSLSIIFKIICLTLLAPLTIAVYGTNYYISNSGNDNNPGNHPGLSWKTLDKLNSFRNLKPGDSVLFKRGDTFYGSLHIESSGTTGRTITFCAYGTGERPTITGFSTLSSWRAVNDTIQKCSINLKTHPEMVTIDGVPRGMGRYPNTGYLTYESFVSDQSITDKQLKDTPNWTGAEAVIRGDAWYLTRNVITNHKKNKIEFIAGRPGGPLTANFGYFIQNSCKTLDIIGEWYYDGSDIQMYFGKQGFSPARHKIKVSSIDTLVCISRQAYIKFNNINFEGADVTALLLESTDHITVQNCSFNYSGRIAIANKGTHYTTVRNCTFNYTYNNAISNEGLYSYKGPLAQTDLPDHDLISHNTIKNTGMIAGTGVYEEGGNYDSPGDAIQLNGSDHVVEYNTIDSTGHSGISFAHGRAVVKNNFINNFAFTRNDAGGIYTVLSDSIGSLIQNNVIINGVGNLSGMNGANYLDVHGLYFDNYSKGITVTGNSVGNMHDCGIYGQVAHDLHVEGNTIYDNKYAAVYFREIVYFNNDLVRNVDLINNIFVSRTLTQRVLQFWTNSPEFPHFGSADSNYYTRPINDSLTMTTGTLSTFVSRTLSDWQTYTHQDAHSQKSPATISDSGDLRFEYNPTSAQKSIFIPGKYVDVKGTIYNGHLNLAPYASLVLIKAGEE